MATTEAATNKLLRAAPFDLPGPGCWDVDVTVEGDRGEARCRFSLEAAGPPPAWVAFWPWLAWPLPVVVLYGLHQVLVVRDRRTRLRPTAAHPPRAEGTE